MELFEHVEEEAVLVDVAAAVPMPSADDGNVLQFVVAQSNAIVVVGDVAQPLLLLFVAIAAAVAAVGQPWPAAIP